MLSEPESPPCWVLEIIGTPPVAEVLTIADVFGPDYVSGTISDLTVQETD